MNFSAKGLMELLLLALMPALLFAGHNNTNDSSTPLLVTSVTSQRHLYEPRITTAPIVIRLPPILTSLKVNWDKDNSCQGLMYLHVNFTNKPNALCYETVMKHNIEALGVEICQQRRCGKFLNFNVGSKQTGYIIKDDDLILAPCSHFNINCEDSKELLTYKVLTGVLLALVLAVILLQFARPMYMGIRKRFSQKQENRWIGPTQSQSVSYHRGQAAHSDNNMVKRQSYPGLERLTVNPSREPSSNRNSDYDSYGYH